MSTSVPDGMTLSLTSVPDADPVPLGTEVSARSVPPGTEVARRLVSFVALAVILMAAGGGRPPLVAAAKDADRETLRALLQQGITIPQKVELQREVMPEARVRKTSN